MAYAKKLVTDPKTAAVGAELGVTQEMLFDEGLKVVQFVHGFFKEHGKQPALETVEATTGISLMGETPEPPEYYARELVKRWKGKTVGAGLKQAVKTLEGGDPDASVATLLQTVSRVSAVGSGGIGGLVDLCDERSVRARIAEYEKVKALKGALDGIPTPWESINRATGGIHDDELWVILGKLKSGKCVVGDTLVADPDTGEWRTVASLVLGNRGRVVTLDGRSFHGAQPTEYVDNGVREVLRLSTRLGHTLTATPNHPMLTVDGWKPLEDLCVGERIAAAAKLPEPERVEPLSDAELVMLAAMIAEGGTTGGRPTFTNETPEIVAEVKKAAEGIGCSLTHIASGKSFEWAVGAPGHVHGSHDKSEIRKLLERHKLWGVLSREKSIPPCIFRLSPEQLGRFVGLLWSMDGSVSSKKAVLSYSSSSETLARQVQFLMLRLGVVCRLREKRVRLPDGRPYVSWELTVRSETRSAFRASVSLVGPKRQRLAAYMESVRPKPNADAVKVTPALLSKIAAAARRSGKNWVEFSRALGWGVSKGATRHLVSPVSGLIPRCRLRVFCDVMEADELKWIASEDVAWDEVVSIEPAGRAQTFDLAVAGSHNFVANGLVVHNTFAEIVMAHHAWETGHEKKRKILLVSEEMGVPKIVRRWDAVHGHLPYGDFKRGIMATPVEEGWRKTLESMIGQPSFWVAGRNRVRCVSDLEMMIEELRPDVTFVDGAYFLDADKGGGGEDSKWARTSGVIDKLQSLVQRKRHPIVVSWQFNRKVKTGKADGFAEDVAFAYEVMQNADVVLGLFRPEDQKRKHQAILRMVESRESEEVNPLLIEYDFNNMSFKEIGEIKDEEVVTSPTSEEAIGY